MRDLSKIVRRTPVSCCSLPSYRAPGITSLDTTEAGACQLSSWSPEGCQIACPVLIFHTKDLLIFVSQIDISNNNDLWSVDALWNKNAQRQLRYIEWKGVKIYDFQKATFSTLFKLYIAGLGVLIPKRYHMLGQDPDKRVQNGQNQRQLVLNSAKKMEKRSQFCNRLTYRPPQYVK